MSKPPVPQLSIVYAWPLDLYNDTNLGAQTPTNRYLLAAVGVGAMYWWGGMPDLSMRTATSYLVGGVAVYAAAQITNGNTKYA